MELNRDKWYVRWYFWSLGICEEFRDDHYLQRDAKENGTNLCAFMRVVLVYTPLILLFTAIAWTAALVTITVLPIWLFGFKGYGIGVGALVALCIFVYLTITLVVWLKDKRESKALAQEQTTNIDATSPSFVRVLGRWVVAKKRKVCPLIAFVERDRK